MLTNQIAIALSLPLGAALLLQANPSQALIVNVGGTSYDIKTFIGSLADFQTSGLNSPWLGSIVSATAFADAFTAVNNSQYNSISGDYGDAYLGPLFYTLSAPATFVAWNSGTSAPFGDNISFTGSYVCGPDALAPAEFQNYDCTPSTLQWAYGNPTPAPAPAPLPLLGATAAFSFSRKLRRRLSAQKFTF
jgi:hypothetical protein